MVSSRLAQREQKRLLKQTLLIAGSAVLVLVLFLFVILPQVIKFAATVLGGGSLGGDDDTIPPQPPLIAAPATATNSAQIMVQGAGEPKAEVVLVLNGQEQTRSTITDEGDFKLEVPLTDGENSLTLYSIDEAGNESTTTQTYMVVLDTENPTIEMEQPQDGQTIELRRNQVTEIKGKTEPGAQVFINDHLASVSSEGVFTLRYQLADGENKLHIVATDKAGNRSELDLTVTFRP